MRDKEKVEDNEAEKEKIEEEITEKKQSLKIAPGEIE